MSVLDLILLAFGHSSSVGPSLVVGLGRSDVNTASKNRAPCTQFNVFM